MKIAIIADTHDRMSSLRYFFEVLKSQNVKTCFHAGDVVFPPFFNKFWQENIQVYCVKGNNDGEQYGLRKELEDNNSYFFQEYMDLVFDDRRVLMKHKDSFVDSLARSKDYDVIIYGHTHKLDVHELEDTLIINPGTLSGYLSKNKSFVILDLVDLSYQIYEF